MSGVAEELEGGVGVLPVFGDVEALELGGGADAENTALLQRKEDREARAERPDRRGTRAERTDERQPFAEEEPCEDVRQSGRLLHGM